MRKEQIKSVLSIFTETFDISYDKNVEDIEEKDFDLPEFIEVLQQESEKVGLLIVEKEVTLDHFELSISNNDFPIVYFYKQSDASGEDTYPVVDGRVFNPKRDYTYLITPDGNQSINVPEPFLIDGAVKILTAFPVASISEESREEELNLKLTPWQRLTRMLNAEKKDIVSIYVYAILIGAISLVLPLGIQAIIGLVQGGLVFSSIYLLIGLVFVALVISGFMQISQLTLVEYLVERLFSKAALDYTYRVPRIKAEALLKYYPPELMNRFFDIITVQKSLPKLLIDITAAAIQIIFGLLLLTAYHPLFIAFALATVILVIAVARIFGGRTLEANLIKSKYKYKIAEWLQDVARTLTTFKVSGNTALPVMKMERLLSGYLKYRKKYFDYLLVIFYNAVFFKAIVTGGLLIVGTYLVINRQITIGQFVASEIVVVLVVGSVEKILLSLDSVFDLLTGVEKLGAVSDLPLERDFGKLNPFEDDNKGIHLKVDDLTYSFEDNYSPTIKGISLDIKANERVAITGTNGSGKETLLNILSGILESYNGAIRYNGISLHDINKRHLHKHIERNVSADGIFDGTLLENITMKRPQVKDGDIQWALSSLNMDDAVARLKRGLSTEMISSGRRFSLSFSTKIAIARCIVNRPKLLMLSNCYEHIDRNDLKSILNFLLSKERPWTFITVTNDPIIMQACDRVVVLDEGEVALKGKYEDIQNSPIFQRCIH